MAGVSRVRQHSIFNAGMLKKKKGRKKSTFLLQGVPVRLGGWGWGWGLQKTNKKTPPKPISLSGGALQFPAADSRFVLFVCVQPLRLE